MEELINKLKEKYNDLITIKKINSDSFCIILKNNSDIYDFVNIHILKSHYNNIDEFNNILLQYNFTYDFVFKKNNKWNIIIKKLYKTKITKELLNKKSYLYYFTDIETKKNILKNGLSIIDKDKLYMYATNKSINEDATINIKDIYKFIMRYVNLEEILKSSYLNIGIIGININKDIDIYKDNTSINNNCVFIYNNEKLKDKYLKDIRSKYITIENIIKYYSTYH